MINNAIRLTADIAPLDNLTLPTSDYSVDLGITGNRVSDAMANMKLNEQSVCLARQSDVYAMFSRVLGAPMHEWGHLAEDLGLRTSFPEKYTTVQQNLAKAMILVALWIEPSMISENPSSARGELVDELIVDYSGMAEPQRYVYFPPQNLSEEIVTQLYRLHLLCRLRITLDGHPPMSRYFIPLVTPGVAMHWFERVSPTAGGRAYQAWRDLRKLAASRVDRAIRRMQ